MRLPLPIHSYDDAPSDAMRLVNVMPEVLLGGAKGPMQLVRCPGVRALASLGNGPGRGLAVHQNRLYAVSGDKVYKISHTGAATNIGTIPGTGRTYRASNGIQLVIIADSAGYSVNTGVDPISDSDFTSRDPGACGFADNFIALVERSSGRWFISDLADGTVYDPLDFATAEGDPDNLISLIVDHRQVILFGARTVEVWYNAGATGFPFERMPGGFIELGCLAEHSPTKADNSVFWLASDRTWRRLSGSTPVRVSSHGMERAIARYATVSDAEGYAFTVDGHVCVALSFPTEGATWVLDITTGEVHERSSYLNQVWAVTDSVTIDGVTYVQHRETGAVGILDPDTFTEWGEPIRSSWVYGSVTKEGKRVFHRGLYVRCQTGVGLVAGQGFDPVIGLDWSDDGGQTWNAAPMASLGKLGDRARIVTWSALGSSRDRVYRNWVSDPVQVKIHAAELEADVGTS